jgi:HD-like signal output (HDOD) protein
VIATAPGIDAHLKPPAELIQALKKRAGQLQMLPAVAQEALQLVKDHNCSIAQFTSIIKRDVKLTADILKMANSALYRPVTPILDLNRCVMRVGFRECQYLILSASIASLMNRVTISQEWVREALWRHSFTTALLATRINRQLHLGFQGEEFTAGLLHDFGRILFAIIVPDSFLKFDALDFDESPEQLEREYQATGTDHCRLAAWFAHGNQLPPPIPTVILHHHQPELADEQQRLTALIAVADQLANDWQRLGDRACEAFMVPAALSLLIDDLSDERLQEFSTIVPTLLAEAQRDAAAMMSAK